MSPLYARHARTQPVRSPAAPVVKGPAGRVRAPKCAVDEPKQETNEGCSPADTRATLSPTHREALSLSDVVTRVLLRAGASDAGPWLCVRRWYRLEMLRCAAADVRLSPMPGGICHRKARRLEYTLSAIEIAPLRRPWQTHEGSLNSDAGVRSS